MPKRDQDRKIHMHEYDDNWQCRCGFRLVTELDHETGIVNVKACVTADGQTVALEDSANRTEKSGKQLRKKKRANDPTIST